MRREQNLENKWLIKSENRILGPYNFEQVIDLIRKKQISIIDEVRDPETRWLYVRENSEFKVIVDEMRSEIDARTEGTKTFQSSASKAVEDTTMQKTRTDVNQFTDINIEAKELAVTNEVIRNPAASPVQKTEKAKVYGVQTDVVIQNKMNIFSNKILVGTVVGVALLLSSFFGYLYVQKRNILKQEEELTLQIKKYKYLGLYQKAVDLFAKLPGPNQKKMVPELLEIFPLLESTGLVALEDVKSLKTDSGLSQDQKANIEIINFLASMHLQNYGQAQEFLVKATALLPTSLLIKENEALLNLKRGQFANSYNLFKSIFLQDKNGRYLLGMVQAFYGLAPAEKAPLKKELLSNLEKYTTVYYDFKKELLLAQISLAHDLDETVLFKVSKSQFFNTPCLLSKQFLKPNLIAQNTYAWTELNEIKTNVQKILSGDELILFQVHDFLEASQLSSATEFVTNNIAKISNPAIREQINLLLYNAQKRTKELLALEKTNQLDMGSELNHLLLAFNKLEKSPTTSVSIHQQFLVSRQQMFYKEWIDLEQLIAKNSVNELKTFVKDHFVTVQNFAPLFVAKNMVN